LETVVVHGKTSGYIPTIHAIIRSSVKKSFRRGSSLSLIGRRRKLCAVRVVL
jgi:hypothetical protein